MPLRSKIDTKAILQVCKSLVSELQKQKQGRFDQAVGVEDNIVSPRSTNNNNFVPTLRRWGIPYEKPLVIQGLIRDIISLNKKFATKPAGGNLISFDRDGAAQGNLLLVPKSKDLGAMKSSNRHHRWFDHLLVALSSSHLEEDKQSTLHSLLLFIAQSETTKETWARALKDVGVPLPKLDGVATKAIQNLGGINGKQMRVLRHCLRIELGCSLFGSDLSMEKSINVDYVPLHTDKYKHGSVTIPWSYRDLFIVFQAFAVQADKEEAPFQIDIAVNLDHGKGHSRISCKFIARYYGDDGNHCWFSTSSLCTFG